MDFTKGKETTLFKLLSLILIEKLEVEKAKIAFDSTFKDDLGADSLDMYELIFQFEESLSVSISDEEAVDVFKTIGSLYQFLEPKCSWIDDPKTAEDYAKRGNAYYGKYLAYLNYYTALEIDANCISALIGRAELYQKDNSFEQAIMDFTKVLELSPSNSQVLTSRGNCYLGLAETEQSLNDNADDNPESGMDGFRHNIGETLAKALADFNEAIKANGQYYEAVHGRAKTYYRMGKFEESASDFKYVIENSLAIQETPEMVHLIEKGFLIIDD